MSDGKVTIVVDVDGKAVTSLNGQLDQLEGKSHKASGGIKQIVTSLGLVKLASAALNVLKSSLDAAISRFDTMQKFPKVMSALGFSTEDSAKAVAKLADGIEGLPTKLNEVVSTAQRMTAITGNLNKSTNATIGLNNAMLASGASAADASRGLDQYIRMLSTGEVDLQSWKTLQETMPIGLQKVAEAMGYLGQSAQRDLYAALKEGTVTFDDFQDKIIELGTGTGELAELAKINSEGIATSFGNLGNAVSKGLANVIKALDDLSKEVTGKTIAGNFDSLKYLINSVFASIVTIINASIPVVKLFVAALNGTASAAKTLSPILIGLAAAYGTLKILNGVNSLMIASDIALGMAGASGKALTIVTKGHMVAQIADTTATKADTIAKAAQNGVVTLGTAVIGVFSGAVSLSTVASTLAAAATTAFGVAIKVMLGPIGWAALAIGALVTAAVALWKWFTKETEAAKKLNREQEELVESTSKLTDSVKQSAESRQDNLATLESSKKAYKDLGDQVTELAAKENKSATEKNVLKASVEQLNSSMEGLNLAYDAENDKLSMSAEAIQKRIEAFKEQDTANAAQQDLLDIMTQQHEVESKLDQSSKLRAEWNAKLEEGTVKGREHKEAIKELDEQELLLTTTLSELQVEQTATQAVLEASTAAVTEATENGVFSQITSYETLSEAQREAVDSMKATWQEYEDAATNMFDTLSDKQELSVAEMTANLEENQRVLGEWADNIAVLADRGINEGMLNKLRDMGPEGAGYVAALVGSSDEELQRLNDVFETGGSTATEALKTAFDTGNDGINDSIVQMVSGAEMTLKDSISAADFKSMGEDIAKGTEDGITSGAPAATEASGQMADDISDEFKQKAGIHSPSTVFEAHGKFLIEGLVRGINDGNTIVTAAIESLFQTVETGMEKIIDLAETTATALPEAFSSLAASMEVVGINAMDGLANGIYEGAGSALNAAEYVASQIKETIQSALDIHSPSRWMRDQIGKFIPQGIALGIDADAGLAYKAMESLHLGLTKSISPEVALQTQHIGNMNRRHGLPSESLTSTTTTTHKDYRGLFDGAIFHWHNKSDIRETMQEIAWVLETEGANLE